LNFGRNHVTRKKILQHYKYFMNQDFSNKTHVIKKINLLHFGKHFVMHWKIQIEVQMVKDKFFQLSLQNLLIMNLD
jgi:hypothetical protein